MIFNRNPLNLFQLKLITGYLPNVREHSYAVTFIN